MFIPRSRSLVMKLFPPVLPCLFVAALLASVASLGCGEAPVEGPETLPVEGKIVFTKGGQQSDLEGIPIQLQSIEQPETVAFGEILPDGTFSVTTQLEEGVKPGAIPGSHLVRINADDGNAWTVAPQFLDFARSGLKITVPSEEPIELKVWR
jgi:hypothetical protein